MAASKWLTSRFLNKQTLLFYFILGANADPQSAFAQTAPDDACHKDDSCREHYQKAITAYKQESYDEALTEFKAAYDARQMSILLVNIGRTLQKLGRPREAVAYYERFQKAESRLEPDTAKRVQQYMEECRALINDAPAPAGPPLPLPKPGNPYLIAGGVTAGVGVVGIVISAALGGVASSTFGDYGLSIDEFEKIEYRNQTQAYDTGAIVSGIAGAVLVGAGGTLLALGVVKNRAAAAEHKARTNTKSASQSLWLVPSFSVSQNGFAATLRGGF